MTCQFLNILIYLKISNNLFNKYFVYFIFLLNRIYLIYYYIWIKYIYIYIYEQKIHKHKHKYKYYIYDYIKILLIDILINYVLTMIILLFSLSSEKID